MTDTLEQLISLSAHVSTPSTKRRVAIFRHEIPAILDNSGSKEMTGEYAALLVDVVFQTLFIYDDNSSKKAVDDLIIESLKVVTFMKHFAAAVVQSMERQSKLQSHVGCSRLLKWSFLLLNKSQFVAVSKNAFCRLVASQASVLSVSVEGSFRERKACKKTLFHIFSQPDFLKMYIDVLKDARIAYKDCTDLIQTLLEFTCKSPSFEEYKPLFLDMYVKAVLNAKEKPALSLSQCFCSLLTRISHEEFKNVVLPSSIKMLKRNPEIVIESIGILLKSLKLDLSKYAIEILSVVLSQARHAEERRRFEALAIMSCLSQKSSNPDAIQAMFDSLKAVIGGSEGRLAFPYQRIGMINALNELSNAPEGKYLSRLSSTVCGFLLCCYKDEGSEEVKINILTTLAAWAVRAVDAIPSDVITFFASGLKEKETLRRGHLRCLLEISKNVDAIGMISSLFGALLQLVKTGFSKPAQRLDGFYALALVLKIAKVDIKADDAMMKEKMWLLISQNEPSVIPLSMASKLSVEDCITCVGLLKDLLVDYQHRVLEAFSLKPILQLFLYIICHPSWDIRRVAHESTKKVIAAAPQLSESLLLEFSSFLSLVGERRFLLLRSDSEISLDAQLPFLPSTEVLVKALAVIASSALLVDPSLCVQVILSAHHPLLIGNASKDAVWKRLVKCFRKFDVDIFEVITSNIARVCQGLLGSQGLMNGDHFEQQGAIYCLSTMMSLAPGNTYSEFDKHLKNLPDLVSHDMLTQRDVLIFNTPEGTLSNEQGVYIADAVAVKNTNQIKGRRVHEDQNGLDHVNPHNSLKRESASKTVAGSGKKDTGKSTKKIEKGKTAKEEARELLLKEEASVREYVMAVKKNLSLMLTSLGEMAIANPVFSHSLLPALVCCIPPYLYIFIFICFL